MSCSEEIFDVLILGAGLAGLGAARELRKNGQSVCVIEAQDRPGGRVRTVKMDKGITFEAGAQWIHGKDNELFRIAEENNLISPELGEEACGSYIRDDGRVFDDYLVKRVDFKVGQILEECEEYVNCPLEKDVSIREYLEDKFKDFLLDNPDIDPVEANQLLDWHIRFQIIDNSCMDLNDVGVNDWGRYSFNGESCQAHINVKNGLEKVVDVIVKDIGQANIYYGHEVVDVNWGAEVSTVSCRNGRKFKGRFIIVTFSIGVLKDEKLFTPELPPAIKSTIDRMGFGTINKIYLNYENPFWNKDFKGIQFLWSTTDDQEIPSWIKSMTGFDLLDKNTLIGWIGGQGAIEMEALKNEDISKDCVKVLQKLLKIPVPHPDQFYSTRWLTNPFARGSYCYNELRNKDSPRTILHTPLTSNDTTSPTLFLAGEACHPIFFSTAHGAFESGIGQAKEVIKLLRK